MSVFSRLSYISRTRKLGLFYEVIKPTDQTTILDVGAEANSHGERGLQIIDDYPWRTNVTVINISQEHISQIRQQYPEIKTVVGNACSLPWPDKYFDIVYSNAVIEHLGSSEKQKKMASEIMRVGKRWFVSTPNRWYPFEFHMRLPFITWLPYHGYRQFGRIVSYHSVRKRYVSGIDWDEIRLLSATQLGHLFPGSVVMKVRVTFMAENLVVVGGNSL